MALSAKHQQFVNEYLMCWNQTTAYQRVYDVDENIARPSASRLLTNVNIQQEIQRRIDEHAMKADEVLARLAEHARGDMDDYLNDDGGIDLQKARKARRTRLLKKVSTRRVVRTKDDEEIEDTTTSIELYDAQAALVQLGKHHKLFVEQSERRNFDVDLDDLTDDQLDRLIDGEDIFKVIKSDRTSA